jgi:hypothetical protein
LSGGIDFEAQVYVAACSDGIGEWYHVPDVRRTELLIDDMTKQKEAISFPILLSSALVILPSPKGRWQGCA